MSVLDLAPEWLTTEWNGLTHQNVVGDDDLGLFVKEGPLEVYRERLTRLASVITPNQFELKLLTEHKARSAEGLAYASDLLTTRGTGPVVVTGCMPNNSPEGALSARQRNCIVRAWRSYRSAHVARPTSSLRDRSPGYANAAICTQLGLEQRTRFNRAQINLSRDL